MTKSAFPRPFFVFGVAPKPFLSPKNGNSIFKYSDKVMYALRGAVVCFYLSNEGVSLLENAAHLGLPIPEKMKSILAQLHNRIDDTTTDQGGGA